MRGKYFIDTNIIVYAHNSDYPGKQIPAQKLFLMVYVVIKE
jgi:hypothetical protein